MILRLHRDSSRRARRALDRLAERGHRVVDSKIRRSARKIVEQIRRHGDRALLRAVDRFDGHRAASVDALRRFPGRESAIGLAEGFEEVLDRSIAAVERFHRRQLGDPVRSGFRLEDDGVVLEERRLPLRRVGLYVPGGRFPYPSSAIMSVIPARLAGVEQVVVVTPPRALESSIALRQTLKRLAVDEVWAMGGAHAVAALAYGTETIEPVDLIAGPGNAWVTAAKQCVAGRVGVDREAGPSEVVVLASADAPADWVAADLLAQSEHDERALAVLIVADRPFARRVVEEVERQLEELGPAGVARESLRGLSCAFIVRDLQRGLELAEEIAPEHLQLMGAEAEKLADRVRNAGALFVGATTPTVLGDYVAGPSHVLPTGGTARFSSGLGVEDFIRRSHTVRFSAHAVQRACRDAAVFARVEGLVAHQKAAERRLSSAGVNLIEAVRDVGNSSDD